MRQDLQYMVENLTRLHLDAFHSVNKSEFFDAVFTLNQEIERLNDRQFAVRMNMEDYDGGRTKLFLYWGCESIFRVPS